MAYDYDPHVWLDNAEGGTPITADKLNEIETGITQVGLAVGSIDATYDLLIDRPAASNSLHIVYVAEDGGTYVDVGTWEQVSGAAVTAPPTMPTIVDSDHTLNTTTYPSGTIFRMSSASAHDFVLPDDFGGLLDAGYYVDVLQSAAGQVTVVGGATSTVFGANGLKTSAPFSIIRVTKLDSSFDQWVVSGDAAV